MTSLTLLSGSARHHRPRGRKHSSPGLEPEVSTGSRAGGVLMTEISSAGRLRHFQKDGACQARPHSEPQRRAEAFRCRSAYSIYAWPFTADRSASRGIPLAIFRSPSGKAPRKIIRPAAGQGSKPCARTQFRRLQGVYRIVELGPDVVRRRRAAAMSPHGDYGTTFSARTPGRSLASDLLLPDQRGDVRCSQAEKARPVSAARSRSSEAYARAE